MIAYLERISVALRRAWIQGVTCQGDCSLNVRCIIGICPVPKHISLQGCDLDLLCEYKLLLF